MRPGALATALLACATVAVASVALPFAPLYDPWTWLTWGREIAHLDLDTSAGASWKPLPALVCATFAWAGDWAPDAWLAIARTAWFAVPVLAWSLAGCLAGPAGRPAACGAVAAAGVVLVHDGFTSHVRQMTGGLSEPMLAALALGAILAALSRRPGVALWLALAACLLRPEAWPFAAAYAWGTVRSGGARPAPVVAGALLVPLLWFGPDLLAAEDALEGAERAREGTGSPPVEALEVLGRALVMAPVVLWGGFAALLALRPRPDRAIRVLAAGALAWIALVALMAVAGYAGLPRFMAPAAAVVCVLGAVGVVRVASDPRLPAAGVAAVALLALADASWRLAEVPDELGRARDEAASTDDLRALARAERPAILACPPVATTDFQAQPPLAWQLEVPVADVGLTAGPPREGTLVTGLPGEWEAVRAPVCAGDGRD